MLISKKNKDFPVIVRVGHNLKLILYLTITKFITIYKRPEYRQKVICNFYFHHAQGARVCVNQNFQVLKLVGDNLSLIGFLLTKDQHKDGK